MMVPAPDAIRVAHCVDLPTLGEVEFGDVL